MLFNTFNKFIDKLSNKDNIKNLKEFGYSNQEPTVIIEEISKVQLSKCKTLNDELSKDIEDYKNIFSTHLKQISEFFDKFKKEKLQDSELNIESIVKNDDKLNEFIKQIIEQKKNTLNTLINLLNDISWNLNKLKSIELSKRRNCNEIKELKLSPKINISEIDFNEDNEILPLISSNQKLLEKFNENIYTFEKPKEIITKPYNTNNKITENNKMTELLSPWEDRYNKYSRIISVNKKIQKLETEKARLLETNKTLTNFNSRAPIKINSRKIELARLKKELGELQLRIEQKKNNS